MNWKSTNEFRWLMLFPYQQGVNKLQQKWEAFKTGKEIAWDFNQKHGTGFAGGGEVKIGEEWRDVPTVTEESK